MKSKFWCFLVGGLGINLVLIIGIYIYTRGSDSPHVRWSSFSHLKKVCYTEAKNGFKSWELVAEQVNMPQGQKVILKTIKTTFFPKADSPIYLTADKGELDLNTKNIKLEGNVHIWQKKQGYVLITTALDYINNQHVLSTDAPVKIKGDNILMIAKGMRYFIKENKFVLCQKVKTTFITSNDG